MTIDDDYINALFEGTRFGYVIDSCVNEKRKLLAKTLKNQVDGYLT